MVSQVQALTRWTEQRLNYKGLTLQPLYGDASRRRYFRTSLEGNSHIIVDASAELTDIPDFIAIDKLLQQLGLRVPQIIASDLDNGFLIVSDFGDTNLLSVLNDNDVDHWFQIATDDLLLLQTYKRSKDYLLANYDTNLITREWGIFTQWFLEKYHHFAIAEQQTMLENIFHILQENMLEQPQVFVHRDYHSRNLMVLEEKRLGIIDFQGAKWGPITYDLVSLFRGANSTWPVAKVKEWASALQPRMWQQAGLTPISEQQFMRWFDLTGLQRHLKVLGQFARKALAENNNDYIVDMPRVLNYVLQTCEQYEDLTPLGNLIKGLA